LLKQSGTEVHIPVLKLKKATPLHSIVYEIIKDFHFTAAQTADVIALLDAENSKYVQSATHRMIKNRSWLMIAPLSTTEAQNILIEDDAELVLFTGGKMTMKKLAADHSEIINSNTIAVLDAEKIKFPLLLRKWKAGDYFYPLGMKKKKKVARLLIDLKLSKTEKENIWVLESNQKIIWVVGQRIDDRFKLTPSTKTILQILYTPS
jgi:tRNA(Ile)-lysidine synthase